MICTEWLLTSSITRLVLAIKAIETDETLERWQFDVLMEDPTSSSSTTNQNQPATKPGKKKEKTEKEVQGEIREIMKQITSSVTFLPILEEPCTSSQPTPTPTPNLHIHLHLCLKWAG